MSVNTTSGEGLTILVDLFRTTGRGCEWTGSYGSWTVNSV
jgi:hypothetical protein